MLESAATKWFCRRNNFIYYDFIIGIMERWQSTYFVIIYFNIFKCSDFQQLRREWQIWHTFWRMCTVHTASLFLIMSAAFFFFDSCDCECEIISTTSQQLQFVCWKLCHRTIHRCHPFSWHLMTIYFSEKFQSSIEKVLAPWWRPFSLNHTISCIWALRMEMLTKKQLLFIREILASIQQCSMNSSRARKKTASDEHTWMVTLSSNAIQHKIKALSIPLWSNKNWNKIEKTSNVTTFNLRTFSALFIASLPLYFIW